MTYIFSLFFWKRLKIFFWHIYIKDRKWNLPDFVTEIVCNIPFMLPVLCCSERFSFCWLLQLTSVFILEDSFRLKHIPKYSSCIFHLMWSAAPCDFLIKKIAFFPCIFEKKSIFLILKKKNNKSKMRKVCSKNLFLFRGD